MNIYTQLAYFFPWLALSAVATLFVSAGLMQASARAFDFTRPTIPSVFYFTYLVMIFFPAFAVFNDFPGPYRDPYIISVMSVLITVPLGMMLANRVLVFRQSETRSYFSRPPVESAASYKGMYLVHTLIILAMLGLLVHYLITSPVIPLFELIKRSTDPLGLTLAREEAFKLLDPRWKGPNSTSFFYGYLFLRTLLFPVIVMTTLGYFLYSKKWKWFFLFLTVFGAGSFYAISSLARAPISALFMRMIFFLYLYYRGKISKKLIVAGFILMLAFPVLVSTFANSTSHSILDGLKAIGIRLTYAPALDLYYYFEMFPTAHPYLHGHTLVKPFLQLIGANYFYIENFAAMFISPGGVPTAHANAAFVSNLHADFGMYGVLLGGLFCGLGMQGVHIFLVRSPKSMLNMATYAFMVYAIWVLNFASVTSVLLVNGMIPVLLLTWGIHFAARWLWTTLGTHSKVESYA